jgi:hypothetical protein
MLEFLVDNIFVEFEWHIFQQIIARHPYGNKLCPSPLHLFYTLMSESMQKLIKDKTR